MRLFKLTGNVLLITLVSCSSYKQNIMFREVEGQPYQTIDAEGPFKDGYDILPNDVLSIDVYTNNGEKIIEPNPELINTQQQGAAKKEINYLVGKDGSVKLPMIGEIKLLGMRLREAEAAVQAEYSKYYKDPYVVMNFSNKRVVLLGALGGQVIPLVNQNVRLTEVLALGKGLDNSAKANNIRVLRGDKVYQIDLTTIEGYKQGDMIMESGDIVYVEPIRRPFLEAFRDNSSIFSLLISTASIIAVIISLR